MELAQSSSPEVSKVEEEAEHVLICYGYPDILAKNVRVRRKAIKKAIMEDSFDSVYRKMEELQGTLEREYKEERLRGDMNWLKSNCERFYQSIF